jgi:hypothetical protein
MKKKKHLLKLTDDRSSIRRMLAQRVTLQPVDFFCKYMDLVIHTHTHAHTRTHTHTCVYIYTYIYMYIYTHIHTHTHIDAYI